MRNARAKSTTVPVTIPPSVVLALLAEFTAVLPNEAATGMEWKKDPARLAAPSAMNS